MTCDTKALLIFCEDDENSVVVRERDLVGMIPGLKKFVTSQDPNWEHNGFVMTTPLTVPASKRSVKFLLENIRWYTPPENDSQNGRYCEANDMSMSELSQILELAIHWECYDFAACISAAMKYRSEKNEVEGTVEIINVEMGEHDKVDWDDNDVIYGGHENWI
ncbi:unnamed protein product [Caenorhabditis sp. 36 PRJEB53466]|nr:unnamed protein product [Caenorhabditis sp. 36 PRJEB53466]